MRIRSVAVLYMIVMGLLALAGAATISYQEWRRLADINEAEVLISVLGSANRFIEAMALERGVYNQVLVSSEAGLDDKRRLVVERVAFTDAVFEDTFSGLSKLPPVRARLIGEPVEQARGVLATARARADQVWQRPGAEKAPEAARALLAEFIQAGSILDRSIIQLERAISERDPRLGLMIGVSRLSNEMREAAGQRSTLLSRYAGTGQTHEVRTAQRVSELTGEINIT